MLGTFVYCMLDVLFNILFWSTKKTISGISMLYYYYNDYDNDIKEQEQYIENEYPKKINMLEIQKQIINQSKMIKELNSRLNIKVS